MKAAERERKQWILDRMMKDRGLDRVEHVPHLQLLLNDYSLGTDRRREIADNIVAEFRPFLRKGDTGPNYDGPLFDRIMDALKAAEGYGREAQLAAEKRLGYGAGQRPGRGADTLQVNSARFSPDEVQRCLFCGVEYRPAVQTHVCAAL